MLVSSLNPRQCLLLLLALGALTSSACGRSKSKPAAAPAPTTPVEVEEEEEEDDDDKPQLPEGALDQSQSQAPSVVFLDGAGLQGNPTAKSVKFSVIGLPAGTSPSDLKFECKLATEGNF
ncbi:MAG: hypothetical protein RL011_229, partial [Pseudomonadota bacterium]